MHPVTSEIHSGEHPTGSPRRRWNSAGTIIVVVAVTLSIVVVGVLLRPQPETVSRSDVAVFEEDTSDHQIVEQLASIQAGESTRLQFLDFAISDRTLKDLPLQSLGNLDTVIVDQGVVTDEGLAVLARLPDLEQLRLRASPISDIGFAALAKCDQIWLINVPQSRVTSVGLSALQELTNLKQLRIGSPLLGDECCHAIAKLTSLRGLHLIGVPVTDSGLQVLATLPHLESLYLDDSDVSEAGWDWLFQHHPKLHVHVNQQHHDRDPATHAH